MKRIIAMLMLIAVGCMAKAQSQGYLGKYFNASQYMRSPIYFQSSTDTLATQAYARLHGGTSYTIGFGLGLSGSTIYNSRYWKNQDTLKTTLTGVPYLTSGVISIYPDLETNATSGTTRLGRFSGAAEDESSSRSNVFVGSSSGNHVTTGSNNTFIGTATGTSLTTGNSNVFLGRSSGFSATGNYNVMLGNFSGYQSTGSSNTCVGYSSGSSLTSGGSNTYLGNYSGYNATGSSSVFLGSYAGYYETGSDKLFIDNQNRTNEATSRTNSLIYGVFNATPASQTLQINGNVGILKAPSYALDVTGDVNVTGAFKINGVSITPSSGITGSTNGTTKSVVVGLDAGYAEDKTTIRRNVTIGYSSGYNNVTGIGNVMLGGFTGYSSNGSSNVYIGDYAGGLNSGDNNIFIGNHAGSQVGSFASKSNRLIIGMLNEEENGEAGDTTNQLIYGYQDASPAKSRFTINGKIYQNGELRDTANASHAGFMSKSQYTKLQNAYNGRLISATGTAPLTLTLSSNALTGSVAQANTTTSGYLSSTDWNAFNSKIGGSGTSGNIAYFTGTGTIGNSPLTVSGSNITSVISQKTTAAYESAPLGSELLTSSGWSSADWTGGFSTGFTHTSGNTTALTNTLAAVIGNYYQIAFTVTNRSAGSFIITFGGLSSQSFTATSTYGPKATTTGSLLITPTSDFNGTIVISIKQITSSYQSFYAIVDNTGVNSFEIRNSLNTLNNSFIGKGAGRINTTGYNNSFIGTNVGYYNTTGYYNSFIGTNAGYYNTTGYNNSFIGTNAGYSNTTGYNNSFIGTSAGRYITGGSINNTTSDYCTLIGNDTKVLADDDQNEIVVGYNATGHGSNTATWGNTLITSHYLTGNVNINYGTNATYVKTTNTATGSAATDGSKIGIDESGNLELNQMENLPTIFKTNNTEAARITAEGYFYKKGTFANMHIVDNTTPITIPTGTTWTKVTGIQAGEYSNMTVSSANSKITTVKAGRYMITLSMTSKTNTANTSLETCVYIGGSRNAKLSTNMELINANKYSSTSVTSIVNIAASTDIEVYTRHDNGSSVDLTVYTGNLTVEYIGE